MNYLPVNVFSSGQDCSANGVTLTAHNTLVVPCPTGHISDDDIENYDYTILDLIDRGRNIRDNFIPTGNNQQFMFGGNFVWSSDSRFRESYGEYPVPVHDRYEG